MHTKILERLTMYSKTNVRLSLVWMMSCRSTILACFKPFKREARKIKQNGIWSIDKESTVSFQIRCSGRFILFCFGLVWIFFLLLGGKKKSLTMKELFRISKDFRISKMGGHSVYTNWPGLQAGAKTTAVFPFTKLCEAQGALCECSSHSHPRGSLPPGLRGGLER